MRTNLPFLFRRARQLAARIGTPVRLQWVTFTGGTVDVTTGARVGGTQTAATEDIKAPVHFVSAANVSQVKQFAEVEIGDVLVDLPAATVLDGRTGLVFVIDGVTYEQKMVGKRLARSFDAMASGQKLFRTCLLRRKD